MTNATQRDVTTYWATETDPEVFVDHCHDRIREYSDVLRNSRFLNRLMRSWRYYHGMYYEGGVNVNDMAIASLGKEGELAGVSVNDFRSLIQQIIAMITKNRVSVDLLAKSSDIAALTQARLGKLVVEDYAQKAEPFLDLAVEHALIFNVGYISTTWNRELGEEYDADPETNEILYTGDVEFDAPTIFDVIYDPSAQKWAENQWVLIRKRKNKWDLIEKYQDLEDEILRQEGDTADKGDNSIFHLNANRDLRSDKVDTWCFYHAPCASLPEGRYTEFVGQEVIPGYENMALPYKDLPISRITAGELLLTCFGYSPALDMQGPQEALNAETSTLVSSHKTFGIGRVWSKTGDVPQHHALSEGFSVLESNTKPEMLDFTNRQAAEQFKLRAEFRQDQQLLSGINDVRRGSPEGSLKSGSGAAFAFLDAKAVEANSRLQKSYDKAIEESLTHVIQYLNKFTAYPHFMAIPGKQNRPYQVLIQKDKFSYIDCVRVKKRNPLLDTVSGKFQIAEILMQQQHTTREEYLTFLETGNIEPMLESANAQLSLVREENERLLEGDTTVQLLVTDDHTLHVKEHAALLNTTESRSLPGFTDVVLAHIMSHLQALMTPAVQMHQIVLGYNLPLPAMPMAPQPGAAQGGQVIRPQLGGTGQPSAQGSVGTGPGMPGQPRPSQNETALGTRSEGLAA